MSFNLNWIQILIMCIQMYVSLNIRCMWGACVWHGAVMGMGWWYWSALFQTSSPRPNKRIEEQEVTPNVWLLSINSGKRGNWQHGKFFISSSYCIILIFMEYSNQTWMVKHATIITSNTIIRSLKISSTFTAVCLFSVSSTATCVHLY